jgi:hypothetical protein
MGETPRTLTPLNERAGQRQALPTNFRAYVSNVYLPQRRKKWKDSIDQTTTERIGTHLIPAFESFELSDLTRDRLQKVLDDRARSLSQSVVSHLRWDLNAIFKMAAEDTIIQGNPAGSLVTPKEAKTWAKRTMTKEQVRLALSVLDLRERIIFLLRFWLGCGRGKFLRCAGQGLIHR